MTKRKSSAPLPPPKIPKHGRVVNKTLYNVKNTKEIKQHLEEHGWVAVQAIDPAKALGYGKKLQHAYEINLARTGLETAYTGGFLYGSCGHEASLYKCRKDLAPLFAELLECTEDELCATPNGYCVQKPGREWRKNRDKTPKEWYHSDQRPFNKRKLPFLQSVISFGGYDGKYLSEMTSFIDRSHLLYNTHTKKDIAESGPWKGHFYFGEKGTDYGVQIVNILPPGAIVVWKSQTIHQGPTGAKSAGRNAAFVGFGLKRLVNEHNRKKCIENFKNKRSGKGDPHSIGTWPMTRFIRGRAENVPYYLVDPPSPEDVESNRKFFFC